MPFGNTASFLVCWLAWLHCVLIRTTGTTTRSIAAACKLVAFFYTDSEVIFIREGGVTDYHFSVGIPLVKDGEGVIKLPSFLLLLLFLNLLPLLEGWGKELLSVFFSFHPLSISVDSELTVSHTSTDIQYVKWLSFQWK